MGLWDDVKNGIDGKNWESRDIEGIYIVPGRYPIKSRPNFDLFFILPNGGMKVIPEAHNSWDTGGMDPGIHKYILSSGFPKTLEGLQVFDFWPTKDFSLDNIDENIFKMAVVDNGRVVDIEDMRHYHKKKMEGKNEKSSYQ